MEEAKNQPDVKTSTHKKKIQVYAIISIGIIFFALLLLTVVNIFNNMSGNNETKLFDNLKADNQPSTKVDVQKNNRVPFDQLLKSGEPINNTVNNTEPSYAKPNSNTVGVTQNQPVNNPYARNYSNNLALPKAEKTVEQQWLEQEKIRALNSSRAKWVVNQNKNEKINQAQNKNSNNPFDNLKDIEDKRQLNRAKIEEAEKIRQQMQYQASKGNTVEVERLSNSINKSNQSKFKQAPIDVAGYTKENSYQSDIEGKFKIPVGTVISAITTMTAVSDYMGTFKAMIDYDIYDSSYSHILIPKGTEFMIKPVRSNGVNEILQTRMGYTVPWAILPDGNKIDFSKSSGLDRDGVGAIKGDVDYHFFSQFFGVAAYALVSSESSRGSTSANNETSFAGDVGDGLRDKAKPLSQKYINVVPTVTIKSGTPIRIIVEDEIYVDSWKEVYSDYY